MPAPATWWPPPAWRLSPWCAVPRFTTACGLPQLPCSSRPHEIDDCTPPRLHASTTAPDRSCQLPCPRSSGWADAVIDSWQTQALRMQGKWVVAAKHACNDFISQFENALIYTTPEEFSAHLIFAAENQPKALTKDERYQLSWEAATERYLPAAADLAGMSARTRSNISCTLQCSVSASDGKALQYLMGGVR